MEEEEKTLKYKSYQSLQEKFTRPCPKALPDSVHPIFSHNYFKRGEFIQLQRKGKQQTSTTNGGKSPLTYESLVFFTKYTCHPVFTFGSI